MVDLLNGREGGGMQGSPRAEHALLNPVQSCIKRCSGNCLGLEQWNSFASFLLLLLARRSYRLLLKVTSELIGLNSWRRSPINALTQGS